MATNEIKVSYTVGGNEVTLTAHTVAIYANHQTFWVEILCGLILGCIH